MLKKPLNQSAIINVATSLQIDVLPTNFCIAWTTQCVCWMSALLFRVSRFVNQHFRPFHLETLRALDGHPSKASRFNTLLAHFLVWNLLFEPLLLKRRNSFQMLYRNLFFVYWNLCLLFFSSNFMKIFLKKLFRKERYTYKHTPKNIDYKSNSKFWPIHVQFAHLGWSLFSCSFY